jgi:glycosidase
MRNVLEGVAIPVFLVGTLMLGDTAGGIPREGFNGATAFLQAAPWQAGEVCYEVFVRSFQDSDGDGIGDLNGLTERLDYLNDGDPSTHTDLGVSCVWLMPVARSGSYHGYDVIDYYRVDRRYGTEEDFRRFVEAAHHRGIRVLVDMVVNHTSAEHPYFRDALVRTDSPFRGWYRFRPDPGPDNEWGDNNWHRSEFREEYYYGLFWRGMPDLDWNEPAVREEMKRIASFWLQEMDVDGLRLDAVWHLVEDPVTGRAGHVPRTHEMLREYGDHVRSVKPDALTVGEVFDGTEALLAYYPDQLDAYFAFSVSRGILDAVRGGAGEVLSQAVTALQSRVPNHRWAPFLRNHDQTRTMTVLQGDPARAQLAATLLLTLPGIPFVYYGEEIGMTGDKPDPRIRTPMQWEPRRGGGFTGGLPWEPLQGDSMTANVAVMDADPTSLLNHYRRLIHLRSREPALWAGGSFLPLEAQGREMLAYLRARGEERILVVVNLGDQPAAPSSLSVGTTVLGEGEYRLADLLGEPGFAGEGSGGALRQEGGRLTGQVLLDALPALSARIYRLTPGT